MSGMRTVTVTKLARRRCGSACGEVDSLLFREWKHVNGESISMEQTPEGAMQVMQRSGMTGKPIRDAGMGVYIGISYAEYSQAAAKAVPAVSTYTATGGALSVAAGALTAS